MRRYGRSVGLLLFLQIALVLIYLGVENSRQDAETTTRSAWEALDEPAPPLGLERAGVPLALDLSSGPVLVHFWATWCLPCQRELPALLAAVEEHHLPLLAISDEPWSTLSAYFQGEVPPAVVRDPSGTAAARWQVSALPDTFLVREGRIAARMGGAQPWSAAVLSELLRTPARPRRAARGGG